MDEKQKAELEKKVNEEVSKATSPDEIRDVVMQARDEQGRFAENKPEVKEVENPAEEVVFKDTFVIGGKEVEIVGSDAADVLRQYKAAMTVYEIVKTPEPKKEEVKPAATKEELAALGLKVSQGDMSALAEYLEKSGTLDAYLEKKGIKVDEIKKVLDTQASVDIQTKWSEEVKKFLDTSDWPGGTQNEYILKTKLAQLKDDKGQPLAYHPSAENLQKAYEAMKAENLVFKVEEAKPEAKTEERKTAYERSQEQPTEKKKPTSSTLLGTSGESQTRKASPATKLPEITADMEPRQIMEIFKAHALATGQNPDELMRSAAKA